MNYPIADFIIRIKNAYKAGKKTVTSPSSNYRVSVADVLKKYGYIKDYEVTGDTKKTISLKLAYAGVEPILSDVKVLSKPGRRLYSTSQTLPWGKTSKSLIIISTSTGLMSQKEAQSKKLGGELIAEIW
jgi:small subunit ribosomal protein S8